jgi:hypothetical protein
VLHRHKPPVDGDLAIDAADPGYRLAVYAPARSDRRATPGPERLEAKRGRSTIAKASRAQEHQSLDGGGCTAKR